MPTPASQLVAFPLGLKEAVYGTAIADASLITWIPANAVNYPELDIRYRDNSQDIDGHLDPSEREVEHRSGKRTWSFDASAESLLWSWAMQWGLITMSGSADPWTGTIKKRANCTTSPPSFTYFHGLNCAGATGTFKIRKGAVITQQSLEINSSGVIKQTVETMDDGSITASALFSVPSVPSTVKKLIGAYAVPQFGVAGSLVNLSTAKRFRSIKISSNSNAQDIETPGSGVNASDVQYGEKGPSLEVELVIKGDESSPEFGYFDQGVNPTQVQLDMTIDPGVSPLRTWRILMTACHIIGCTVVPKGNENNLNIKLGTLWSSADAGPAQIIGRSGQATFLVGA